MNEYLTVEHRKTIRVHKLVQLLWDQNTKHMEFTAPASNTCHKRTDLLLLDVNMMFTTGI